MFAELKEDEIDKLNQENNLALLRARQLVEPARLVRANEMQILDTGVLDCRTDSMEDRNGRRSI